LSDEEYRQLQNELLKTPTKGDVIQGTGGLRKVRVASKGKGKRGGARVIYYYLNSFKRFYLLTIYAKNEVTNLTPQEKGQLKVLLSHGLMCKRNLFSELSSALSEAKQHSEGKLTLRTVKVKNSENFGLSPSEIVNIREMFNMSRGVFAQYLHTSSRTLENWEQGRGCPNGQAATLLRLVQSHPETLVQIVEL
jgi:putative transcriptional regulator